MKEPKYKVGDTVAFRFMDGEWKGDITAITMYPAGAWYRIYDFDISEHEIIKKYD
jgi:hypothetical protein